MTCPCCGYSAEKQTPTEIAKLLKFSPKERNLFDAFARRFGVVLPMSYLIDAVYADDIDGGPERADMCVGVMVYRMRKKIAAHGLDIVGYMGAGGGRRMVWAADA